MTTLRQIGRATAAIGIGLLLLLAARNAGAAEGNTVDILNTPAAAAFKSGDYDTAAARFAELAEAHPDDTDVLRYYAIALDRAGRYGEAIEVFTRVLTLAPNSVSSRYHLAVSLYKARLADTALQQFQYVLELAAGSRYAELAREYIEAIAAQRASAQRPGAPGRFGLFAQIGFNNDDNIPAAPNDSRLFRGPKAGDRGSEYVALDYYALRSQDWIGALKITGYGTQYQDDVFDHYQVLQYSGGLLLQRAARLGKIPIVAKLEHVYAEMDLGEDREPYSETRETTLTGLFRLSDKQSAALYYQLTDDDFVLEGVRPDITSRDAQSREAGLSYTRYFNDRKADLTIYVEHGDADADGVNYNRDWDTGGLKLRLPLPMEAELKLGVEYTEDEYPDFLGPLVRATDITEYTVELSRWFGRHLLVRLTWSEREEESSYEVLSYQRTAWGLDMSYVY